ncbi:MAG: YihY/virulence factor BrkB family protein [Pyrinomonadaceae bacterium]
METEETPSQLNTSLWRMGGLSPKELAGRVWRTVYYGDFFTRTAALSYYFLLALFPLLLCMTAMLGSFAERGTELRRNLLSYLSRIVPGSASALIYTTVDEITKNADSTKISFGLLAALWAASYGMAAISESLNVAYGVKETRPWWKVRLAAIGLTLALAVLIIIALMLVLYGGVIGEKLAIKLGLGALFLILWQLVQWPIILIFAILAFALIYYFSPDTEHQKWYWITPGSILGLALWLFVSYIFRLYLSYFNNYSVTYGSLGAVIILMLWFYITGIAILFGGELNAEIENAAAEAGASGAKLKGESSPGEQESEPQIGPVP